MVELLEYGPLAPQFIYGWIMKSKWLGFQTLMYYQPNGGFRFWRENETCELWPNGAKPYSFCQSNSSQISLCVSSMGWSCLMDSGYKHYVAQPFWVFHFRNISWGNKIERRVQNLTGPRSDCRWSPATLKLVRPLLP